MTTTGYLRVSTDQQDVNLNRHEILELANEHDLGQVVFVEDVASGTVAWRKRKIGEIVEALGQGDTLIISELSRLGRSLLEVMEILSVCSSKSIRVYAVKGSWTLDDSLQSKVMATVFALAAEIERDMISRRTKDALAARKAAGVKLGRKPGAGKSKLDTHEPEIRALLANGTTQKWIADRYRVAPSTLANWMKKRRITPGKP